MVRHLVSPVALSLTRGSSHITTSLQLAVILGVLHTLATDSVALHRFQVRPVHIRFKCPSRVCFNRLLSSEENSLTLHLFNTFGTGGLTGPGRNGFKPGGRRTGSHIKMQNGPGGGY